MSSATTIHGTWRKPAPSTMDLEAQAISGFQLPLPIPSRTVTHVSPNSPASPTKRRAEETTDPIDDFFGCSRPSRTRTPTHESRHDQRRSSFSSSHEAPPPYPHADLPEYSTTASPKEPETLAMYLFKFGFCTSPITFFVIKQESHFLISSYSISPILDSRRTNSPLSLAHPHF